MRRFSDQVAIVAGGARGIGRAVVERLLVEGATVLCLDVLEQELALLQEEVGRQHEGRLETEVIDITDEESVKGAFKRLYARFSRVDVLVNSAGIIGETGLSIIDTDRSVFEKVLQVNLVGAYLMTKHVLPHMLKNDYGRVLHISSIGGKEGNPGMVGYATSKSALMGLVKAVGKEYAKTGVTINGLAPAVIATPMNAETSADVLAYMKAKIPMDRLGTMEEAAALICWIVSTEASFNTGFIFDLSGGRATF
ncbi:MAG: SDR family oxidoreductase [Saprospiraceae bacterium]|nr:SDR family oxidoreductase [Saprospiraceae bacterium]